MLLCRSTPPPSYGVEDFRAPIRFRGCLLFADHRCVVREFSRGSEDWSSVTKLVQETWDVWRTENKEQIVKVQSHEGLSSVFSKLPSAYVHLVIMGYSRGSRKRLSQWSTGCWLVKILFVRKSLVHCSCENGQDVSFLINALLNTVQLIFRLCTGSQSPLAEGVNRLGYQAQIILKRN